ncbi:ferritin-like domain-containing protein [Desulfosporosinus metallidurans]|uniref:Rubrerythrin n=1 Tax=Desulfosporosinus metallidurans TaxID=1888891 RepID=A0A1Q8QZH0_9FIRM|nr:ferritin family protein [Desulfosporosinus metallidurans]OLN32744.1 Rubrerythrin [Desulfosporosinus metallidurans]
MNILEFAMKMELEGEKYYTEQAEINKDNRLSTVFRMLAKDETMHAKILQNKANKLSYDLKQNETLSEAKNVFSDIGAIKSGIKQIPNQLDVYRLALENEIESITLYRKYLSEAIDDESKRLFEYLIKQEEDHYAIIDLLISLINRSEEWVESAEFGIREEY